MATTPTIARNANQTITTEPKTLPIDSVPRDCTANRITMITAVIIIVRSLFSVNRCSNAGSVFSLDGGRDRHGRRQHRVRQEAAPPSMAGMTSHARICESTSTEQR